MMAEIKRAHEWQVSNRGGVRSMRCRRCNAERLNATGWCYVETIPEQAPNGDGETQG